MNWPHVFPNLPDVGLLLTLLDTNGNSNGSGSSFRREDNPFGIRLSLVGELTFERIVPRTQSRALIPESWVSI